MAWMKITRRRPQGRATDVNGVIRYTGEVADFPDRILMIRPTWFEPAEPPKAKPKRKRKSKKKAAPPAPVAPAIDSAPEDETLS